QIITVKNYYYQQGDSLLKIELDPSLSPSENIERYFRRYKKYERGKNEILKQINLTKEKIDNLMKNMENKNFLEEYISALSVSFVSKKNEGKSSPRTFRSSDGLTIFVGKNNRQNDELTFRIAKGNDMWLHVRDFPGSHVVIQTGGRKDIPRESLLDAAALAVYFSKLKSAEKGNVIYTLRKYVRKPKGAEAGKVLCSQDKNLFIKLDKKRIERLFS
ncbi:MAG: NFACT RNA binding domain-containing protein, partial [Nitrospinota bacterium]